MASAEYLPPLVTKLKGDTSDLMGAFAESVTAAKVWAAEMKAALSSGMKTAGHDSAEAFRTETKKVFDKIGDDIERTTTTRTRKSAVKAAKSWSSSFADFLSKDGPGGLPIAAWIAIAIGGATVLMPAVGAAIGVALAAGISTGIAGLGFFLLKDDKTIIKRMHALGGTISKIFHDAAEQLKTPFLSAISWVQKWFISHKGLFTQMFAAIAPDIGPMTEGLFGALGEFLPGFTQALRDSQPVIMALAKELPRMGKAFGKFLDDAVKHGPELVHFVHDFAAGFIFLMLVLGKTIGWLSQAYDAMSTFGQNLLTKWLPDSESAVKGWYDAAVKWLGGAVDWIKALPGRIWAWLQGLPGMLRGLADQAWRNFNYAIGFGIVTIVRTIAGLPERAHELFMKFYQYAKDAGARAVVNFMHWIGSLPGRTGGALGKLVDKTKEWAAKAPGWLYNAGKDLLVGLVHGVADSLDWAVGKIKEGMHEIKKGAEKALGVASPSTVFAAIGKWSVLGYVAGVRKHLGAAVGVWGGLVPSQPPRPIIGGPTLSPALVRASGAPSGSVVNATAQGEAVLVLDGKVLARAQIGPVQRANARYNRPIYGTV